MEPSKVTLNHIWIKKQNVLNAKTNLYSLLMRFFGDVSLELQQLQDYSSSAQLLCLGFAMGILILDCGNINNTHVVNGCTFSYNLAL